MGQAILARKTTLRKIAGWFLWLLLSAIALLVFQVAMLAFPQVLFSGEVRIGSVVIHHDEESDGKIRDIAADVNRRIAGSGFSEESRVDDVFFFNSSDKYEWFARLAFVTTDAQGFNLSILGNSYVCSPKIAALAQRTAGIPKYGTWEGNPAHTIAHEIGHQIVVDRIGRGVWTSLPHWKQEGIPEYIANIAEIRRDSLASLSNRFDILNNDSYWGIQRRWDRVHYEAGLLIEFLLDVRDYELEDIIADSVTRDRTLELLASWCKDSRDDS